MRTGHLAPGLSGAGTGRGGRVRAPPQRQLSPVHTMLVSEGTPLVPGVGLGPDLSVTPVAPEPRP